MSSTTTSSSPQWTRYGLWLPLASPLHCGWRAVGNLKQTRAYVPASALWGAFVARYARDEGGSNYAEAQRLVTKHLRFSYLFPRTEEKGKDWEVLEQDCVGSAVSTATKEGRNALGGSLHEIEHVMTRTRAGLRVYLSGYCWVGGGPFDQECLKRIWPKLQVGGERSYGYGRFARVEVTREEGDGALFDGWENPQGSIEMRGKAGMKVMAHVETKQQPEAPFEMEALMGRERQEGKEADGEGVIRYGLSQARILYAPGTKFTSESTWTMDEKGVWLQA